VHEFQSPGHDGPGGRRICVIYRVGVNPMRIINRSKRHSPRLSIVLLDWGVRESFHILHYLKQQSVPREAFEVIVIEYYDHISRALLQFEDQVDTCILLEMPQSCYYHKHLMYNAGIVFSAGEILMFGDSDALVRSSFVETILAAFDRDPMMAYHLDEFRNARRDFYPFNYPSFEEVLGDGCINNIGGQTKGILDDMDPMHTRNFGACMCARREDILAIGGADEDIRYLGHICGPYEMTFRLMNSGRRMVWEKSEHLYHTWHPGSDGVDNYAGPDDGLGMSGAALEALCSGRVKPWIENRAVRLLRTGVAQSLVDNPDLSALLIDRTYIEEFNRAKLGGSAVRPVAGPAPRDSMYAFYRGFRIYHIDGCFYAVPPEFGEIVPGDAPWRADERVVCGKTFTEARDTIDTFETRLIERVNECNVCSVGKRYAIITPAAGSVSFHSDKQRSSRYILWADSLREARQLAQSIDFSPRLVLEDYKGFNIVRYYASVYGIRQSLGPVDVRGEPEVLNAHCGAGNLFTGASIESVQQMIDAGEAPQGAQTISS
jgi:hypothetical protein